MRKALIVVILALTIAISVQMSFAQSTTGADISTNSSVFTAWQPFERGVMMWFEDSDQIWVFDSDTNDGEATGSGTLTIYTDGFSDGDGNNTASSGGCSDAPVRGFGQVWSAINGESAIGCPLADEIGYDSGGRASSSTYSVEILGPGNTRYGVNISSGSSSGSWTTISYR